MVEIKPPPKTSKNYSSSGFVIQFPNCILTKYTTGSQYVEGADPGCLLNFFNIESLKKVNFSGNNAWNLTKK